MSDYKCTVCIHQRQHFTPNTDMNHYWESYCMQEQPLFNQGAADCTFFKEITMKCIYCEKDVPIRSLIKDCYCSENYLKQSTASIRKCVEQVKEQLADAKRELAHRDYTTEQLKMKNEQIRSYVRYINHRESFLKLVQL